MSLPHDPEKGNDNKAYNGSFADIVQPYDRIEEPQGCGEIIRNWPKTTFCIVGNEFCERFSFYGMRTILTLYLLNILGFDDDTSTAVFHGFTVLAYSSPILGSILADGFIGKFHTILWVSLLYAFGQVLLSVSSTFPKTSSFHWWLDMVGLLIIALGTGGIKPCVSAFGGDQFSVGQERMISMYFSMFYFSINAGSTISTFLTPVLRTKPCLGQDSCYPLAFGVPAVLMVVATVIFLAGSFWYKKLPPKENVIFKVIGAMKTALVNKSRSSTKRDHWIDHYCDTNPGIEAKQLASDIKALLRVMVMYIPVPVFWALFDQQGSRWIIQGVAMDGKLWEGYSLLPDQMQVVNAILIMIFIPIFQGIIYPVCNKIGLEPTPLRKMAVGGFLAALAFGVSGFLQLKVETTKPQVPSAGETYVDFQNNMPTCALTFKYNDVEIADVQPMTSYKLPTKSDIDSKKVVMLKQLDDDGMQTTVWMVSSSNCPINTNITLRLGEKKAFIVPITPMNTQPNMFPVPTTVVAKEIVLTKPTNGEGESAVTLVYDVQDDFKGLLLLCLDANETPDTPCNPKNPQVFHSALIDAAVPTMSDRLELREGDWYVYKLPATEALKDADSTVNAEDIHPYKLMGNSKNGTIVHVTGQGALYSATINHIGNVTIEELAPPNSVSILFQLIQYAIITAGEILFSITGLDFSYSQAPTSMKSVIQAVWLFTVAVGDLLIIVIAELRIFDQLAYEMFFFGGLMVIVMIVFSLMAIFYYEYNYYTRAPNPNNDGSTTTSQANFGADDEFSKM